MARQGARGETETGRFDTFSQAVSGLSSGMSALVRGHLDLARAEMAHDLKAMGRDVGVQVGGAPLLMVGYLLLWVAIGSLLTRAMQPWVAFLVCSVANFSAGAAMMLWGHAKLKRDKVELPATASELRRDKSWLGDLRHPTATVRPNGRGNSFSLPKAPVASPALSAPKDSR